MGDVDDMLAALGIDELGDGVRDDLALRYGTAGTGEIKQRPIRGIVFGG